MLSPISEREGFSNEKERQCGEAFDLRALPGGDVLLCGDRTGAGVSEAPGAITVRLSRTGETHAVGGHGESASHYRNRWNRKKHQGCWRQSSTRGSDAGSAKKMEICTFQQRNVYGAGIQFPSAQLKLKKRVRKTSPPKVRGGELY